MIFEALAEAHRRDPTYQRRWVVLIDGAPWQLECVRARAALYGKDGARITIIVDLIHVLGYLWEAAHALHGRQGPEANAWLHQRLAGILQGRGSYVAAGMRHSATRRGLGGAERKAVDTCARYLLRYADYLRYDRYLAQGYPIATGVIEGACRHLIRDRMDITGARWRLCGAEAVLKLRALKASGDFDAYWAFHHRLLLLEPRDPPEGRLSALRSLFRTVVRPAPSASLLPLGELFEALASPKANDLAVAVTHDPAAQAVYVLRGNLETATFPESAFHGFGNGPTPDLSALQVEDGGQTLQAGDFEAAFDALLYEHDPDFRRRLKQQRRESELTLGASIRRLRSQRGLRQSDFVEVSAKEIARIERGEVTKPRSETVRQIARRLGVTIKQLQDH